MFSDTTFLSDLASYQNISERDIILLENLLWIGVASKLSQKFGQLNFDCFASNFVTKIKTILVQCKYCQMFFQHYQPF